MGNLGEGIPREDVAGAEENSIPAADVVTEEAPEKDSSEQKPDWSKNYEETPQTLDQMEKHPETVKFGPVQFAVFDLSKDEDKVALNSKMALTEPDSAPCILIKYLKEEFNKDSGNFMVLLRYQRVFYKHLKL